MASLKMTRQGSRAGFWRWVLCFLAGLGLRAAADSDFATIYQNERNPLLQELKLRGRYHGQFWSVEADQGRESDWEDRRSRFGFDAKFFQKALALRLDFKSNDGFKDAYDGLVDANLRWKIDEGLQLSAGKMQPRIGEYDWLQSSNAQPSFESSHVFNQLGIERASGLALDASRHEFFWRCGIFSNDTPAGTRGSGAWGDGEWGDFEGGFATTLGVGYDFKRALRVEKAVARIDWLHSEREPGDFVQGKFDDIISATWIVENERAGMVVEGFLASGGNSENQDLLGFYLLPTYQLIPGRLELVARYAFSAGNGGESLTAQRRYEQAALENTPRGDRYHAVYLGVQYFFQGDSLKLLSGVEYARLDGGPGEDDYQGVTFLTGIRCSF